MGKLLALSLVTTLAAAVLFQPVLMGPPREIGDSSAPSLDRHSTGSSAADFADCAAHLTLAAVRRHQLPSRKCL